MSVLVRFIYEVKPGRFNDFMTKLQKAASPEFTSETMPIAVKLYRNSVPGPDTSQVILHIEYKDMAAYGARTDFEINNATWRELFSAKSDSPEQLLSVEVLTELT
jgi:hypothetical protein